MKPEKAFRIRLVKILEILRQETDEDNPMPTNTLIKKLAEQGIECDRRTLYRDIQVLNDYGYEVLCTRAISNEYYVVDRSFDILGFMFYKFLSDKEADQLKKEGWSEEDMKEALVEEDEQVVEYCQKNFHFPAA